MKVWTKRHFLRLKSGRRSWRFTSEKLKQSLVIECDRDGWWSVTNDPWDIMKEVFYPAHGYAPTLREAMAEFRIEIRRTDRKKF